MGAKLAATNPVAIALAHDRDRLEDAGGKNAALLLTAGGKELGDDVKPKLTASGAALALLVAISAGHAQPAPAPAPSNPLDTVPDKMPYDVPYGTPITLDRAQSLVAAAVAEARKHNWKMNVAVVDSGGNLVSFARMDDAQLASIAIAEHKARAAVMYRRETKLFENGIQGGMMYQLTLDGVIGSRGGIPLVEGGKLIGAIGASGGAGSQDEICAKAGAAAMKPAAQ